MMRTETTTRTIYTFDELSESAKEKAREWLRDCNADDLFWSECAIDTVKQAGALLGIDIDRVYFSGFWSQGDGACFEGRYKYRKGWKKALATEFSGDLFKLLSAIGEQLQKAQLTVGYTGTAETRHSGYYYHSGCMRVSVECDEKYGQDAFSDLEQNLTDALREFADWAYQLLEKEYEYTQSAEYIDENIRANEYEFDESGRIA